jgi:apolipoprotein N-acyltransferase
MKFPRLRRLLPDWKNAALAVVSAILLILAFPDFEFWFLAWFGLVPLLWAIEREKGSVLSSFVLGWLWGFVFFSGTCWWLTFAPITYADFPWPLAYFLLLCLTAFVGIFSGTFAFLIALRIRRRGTWLGLTDAALIWVAIEFLRYWLTGNDWNALGYSQAFGQPIFLTFASVGGVSLVSFLIVSINTAATAFLIIGARIVQSNSHPA